MELPPPRPTPVITRCPYTLKPLGELEAPSKEHILPDAIGGPDAYSVTACAKSNNTLGSLVDAPFVDDPYVRICRVQTDTHSRSGPAKVIISGTTDTERRNVILTFTEGILTVHHCNPVQVTDHGNGKKLYRITGNLEQSERIIGELKKNATRKGITLSETRQEPNTDNVVHTETETDLHAIRRGLIKILYLATFEFLGDEFLDDPKNPEWLKAIWAKDGDELETVQLNGTCLTECADKVHEFIPGLESNQHGFAIVNLNGKLHAAVCLFGSQLLCAVCRISDTNDYGIKNGEGKVVICNSDDGTMQQHQWMQYYQSKKNESHGE